MALHNDTEPCMLLGVEAARRLLEGYDRTRDSWSSRKVERFWSAVQVAHRGGRTGAGVRIAVIDGSFDLGLPRLSDRVRAHHPAPEPGALEHGTAVALLITEVAPDCELLLYEVCDPSGVPDYDRICSALAAAVDEGADAICMSLGRYQWVEDAPGRHGGEGQRGFNGRSSPNHDLWECRLCRLAEEAASRGAVLAAAAGNDPGMELCPARSSAVVACGFHIGTRRAHEAVDGEPHLEAASEPPEDQARLLDFSIERIPDVLGTSFAAPLFAGFVALCGDRGELPAFMASLYTAGLASALETLMNQRHEGGGEPPSPEEVQQVGKLFERAADQLPHRHGPDATACPECSLFAETLFADRGRFLLRSRRFGEAERWLRLGRRVLPSSPHVAVNLGAVLLHSPDPGGDSGRTHRLREARDLYERATALSVDPEMADMCSRMIHQIDAALGASPSTP